MENILEAVSDVLKVDRAVILSPSQKRESVKARQMAMYCCKQLSDLTLEQIGRIFGRDHSTVVSSCHVVKNHAEIYKSYRHELSMIMQRINDEYTRYEKFDTDNV